MGERYVSIKIPPSILRHPPPPRWRMAAVKDEEGNTEVQMAGGNCTRTVYLRRCKRKRLRGIESLPDELVFEVLARLPAQDIYDTARLVCRKWYHMIHTHNFIHAHLQQATYGLLFQSRDKKFSFFMVVRKGRIEISKYRYKFRCRVNTSCNGLLLEHEEWNIDNLYISNPATRQIFVLPPNVRKILNHGLFGVAYAVASAEYKVVIPFPRLPNKKGLCYILTVGVDSSWRTVRTEHLSYEAMRAFCRPPLITQGFMHWQYIPENVVLTMNVETEIITETSAPIPRVCEHGRNIYLSAGRYLSLFVTRGVYLWDVWEMKPETREWRKLRSISLEAQKHSFEPFGFRHYELVIPVGWLKYLEVLVFSVSGPIRPVVFIYNLLSQEMDTMKLPSKYCDYSILVHKNSLVWLGGS